MGAGDRREGQEFQREIPVGDRIERIAGRLAKAKGGRRLMAIDRKAGSGERGRAEGAFVHPSKRVAATAEIARRHLGIGEAMMAEGDGLGDLKMGEARHHRIGMGLGLVDEGCDELEKPGLEALERRLHMEPEVDGDLIVARAGGVEPAGRRADQFGQPRLDIHMDVFAGPRKGEAPLGDLVTDRIETLYDLVAVLGRNDAAIGQHDRMGFRTGDIFLI